MCGRTACTLDPDNLRRACTYRDRQGNRKRPQWRNAGGGNKNNNGSKQTASEGPANGAVTKQMKYFPSYNIAPQAVTPVLVSSKHFDKYSSGEDRNLTLMKWGLVPSWHKGDPSSVAFKMNNCRAEGMMEKATFKRPFEKGQRCVVLADGYYEWHTDKAGKKQPYFIYFAHQDPVTDLPLPENYDFDYSSEVKQEEEEEYEEGTREERQEQDEDGEWEGHRLLTMAGIFDVWNPPDGGDPLYSYSIITIESEGSVAWIHHRMPVFLENDMAVRDWLDFGSVPSKKALSLVKAKDCLACHPVTQKMGNIRYKASDCLSPVNLEEKKPATNTFMTSWLKKGSTPSKSSTSTIKTEPDITPEEDKPKVKKEKKKTGLTSWLTKANDEKTLKRALESVSPKKPTKMPKRELTDGTF